MPIKYAEHHAHTDEGSNLRLVDTTNTVEGLLEYSLAMGLSGVTITDHEALCSHIKAMKWYREKSKDYSEKNFMDNFKLLFGNEIYLIPKENEEPEKGGEQPKVKTRYYHFLLIARSIKGYHQLMELSTIAWNRCRTIRGIERVWNTYDDIDELRKNSYNNEKLDIVSSSSCIGSYFAQSVFKLISLESDEEARSEARIAINTFVKWCVNTFNQFYIELQPALSVEQIEYNKKAIQIAKFYNLKVLMTNDVHYLSKEDAKIHEAFLHSKDGEREVASFYENCYMKQINTMWERVEDYMDFDVFCESIQSSIDILDSCEHIDLKADVSIPELTLTENDFKVSGLLKKYIE